MLQQQIAVCVLENFWKTFVGPTEFSPICFLATCCSNNILLQRQRFSQVHMKRFVAVTCRLTVLLQLVALPVDRE